MKTKLLSEIHARTCLKARFLLQTYRIVSISLVLPDCLRNNEIRYVSLQYGRSGKRAKKYNNLGGFENRVQVSTIGVKSIFLV